jgi:hypothetical protein
VRLSDKLSSLICLRYVVGVANIANRDQPDGHHMPSHHVLPGRKKPESGTVRFGWILLEVCAPLVRCDRRVGRRVRVRILVQSLRDGFCYGTQRTLIEILRN